MGTKANVIVSAFAAPPSASMRALAQPTELFSKPTVIVEVPYTQYMRPEYQGMAARAFAASAAALKDSSGSILKNLFSRYLVGYDPESIALVSFSAGGVFASEVLKGPDSQWIDTVIDLDGVALNKDWRGKPIASELKPWVDFAERAALDERLMVLAHTRIAALGSAVTSTAASSEAILSAAWDRIGTGLSNKCPERYLNLDDYAQLTPPPPAVTITPGGSYPSKTFYQSPFGGYDQLGNLWVLDYGGTGPSDHIYVAWYAQRDIWRYFLVPRWNVGAKCRYADMKNPVSGYGLGATCVPDRVIVPAGVYPTSGWGPWLAALEGLAVGTSLGYLLGGRIGT